MYCELLLVCMQPFFHQVQNDCANLLLPYFAANGLVDKTLQYAVQHMEHVMDFTRLRALGSLFSMVCQIVRNVLNYNQMHSDFPMKVSIL